MGSRGDTSGGAGDRSSASNVPPSKRKYSAPGTLSDPREKDDTEAKKSLFREAGATNIREQAGKITTPLIARALSGPLQRGSRINRDYFKNEVLTSERGIENFGTSKADFERKTLTEQNRIYEGYMKGRQSGQTDAYGNRLQTGDDKGPKSVEQPKVAAQMNNQAPAGTTAGPTDVEVGQTYAEATMDRKKRGRKSTVLTSVTGDTSKPTLAKKVLLGG